jgi:DNA-binding PadR family transcriptional regulator
MAVPTTRLLVLACVRFMQPVHGYDLRRELLSWKADEWANVKPGSVYGAIKTLHRDGLLEVEGVEQGGSRPERTRYRITPEGDKEFESLLRTALWSAEQPKYPYLVAASLFPAVPREEVCVALRARLKHFEAEDARLDSEIVRILAGHGNPALGGIPHHVADSLRLAQLHVQAEMQWSRETLARIESGGLGFFRPTDSQA